MRLLGNSKITLHHVIILIIILFLVSLIFLIETPLISEPPEGRKNFYELHSIGGIILTYFIIICFFAIAVYVLEFTRVGYNIKNEIAIWYRLKMRQWGQEVQLQDKTHERTIFDIDHDMNMKEVEHLREMAEINYMNAKTDIEKAKAELLKGAIPYLKKLSQRWFAYVVSRLAGCPGSTEEDFELDEELQKVRTNQEKEKWRQSKYDTKFKKAMYDAEQAEIKRREDQRKKDASL